MKPAPLVEFANPNRNPTAFAQLEGTPVNQLSRRDRERIEKERAHRAWLKRSAEGKTDQAKADMARLAVVRAEREAAAKARADALEGETVGHHLPHALRNLIVSFSQECWEDAAAGLTCIRANE